MVGGAAYFSPPLSPYGITRTGDLTGLDIIGLPVWFAVRPNSRTLSVSQGKGLTHEQARISAIMESIEGAVAEQTRALVAEFGTPDEMAACGRGIVSLRNIARCKFSSFNPRAQRAWVRGRNYGSHEPVYAPYELVGLDMRPEFPWDYASFNVGSAGLAAGPDFCFAAVAAILELVERDAIALSQVFGLQSAFARQLIWQADIDSGLDEAVAKLHAAGLEPRFFDIPNKIGLPVVGAVIARPVLHEGGGGERLSGGYACRIDAGGAMLAALLEAVQSRLTNIAGSRDDMDASQYGEGSGFVSPIKSGAIPLAALAETYPSRPHLTYRERLDFIFAKLTTAGYPDVYFFDLPGPVEGISVVRALVPGLKAFVEGDIAQIRVEDLL